MRQDERVAGTQRARVEPEVLRWARETCGLSPLAAARRLHVTEERLLSWESPGPAMPTVRQLKNAAQLYRRSLAVFFLPTPPVDFDTMRDFRRHHGATAGEWTPELHGEYRRSLAQREAALELAEIDDRPVPDAWRVETRDGENDEQVAARTRTQLFVGSPLPIPTVGGEYEHLNAWTAAIETAGVMVLATEGGRVKPGEARAFSLFFDEMPVVVVNGSDWPRARLFSLAHEMAHLALRTSGLCDTLTDRRATDPDRALEARCNAIAAAMLMPAQAVLARPAVQQRPGVTTDWDYDLLASIAAPFGVSAEAMLRRLVTLGRSTWDYYEQSRREFVEAYEVAEQRKRDSQTGGDWYRNTARDRGKAFVRAVADARARRVIDDYTAATFLQVKVEQITRLAQMAELRTAV